MGELPIDEILMEKNTAGNQNDLISQVLAFVLEAMNSKDFLKLLNDYLQNGKLIFFFDGLDEVVDKNMRQIVAESISDFVKKYSQCRYVVTCRTATYPHTELEAVHKPWMLRDFHVITLGTWDEKRISQFIEFWFRELSKIGRFNKNIGKNKAENLDNALKTRPEMRGIAASPLLLTVMAIVHDHYGELPDTRVALYQKCTDLLLWRWEAVKHGSRVITEAQNPDILNSLKLQRFVKPRDIEQVLYQIVYKAHSLVKDNTQDGDNASARIGVNELKNELAQLFKAVDIAPKEAYEKATEFVDYYIRERVGLFEEKYDDASGAIYFVAIHRSFQEYLAARHLCSQRDFSPLAVSLVIKSFDQWREVFLMAVEQMVHENYGFQAIDAVNRLYEEDNTSSVKSIDIYILVGDSVAAIGKPALNKDPIGKKLIKSMSGTFYGLCKDSQLAITKRSQIGSLLGEIGDPRFEPVVDAEHEQAVIFPSLIRIPEGIFMMGDEKLFEVKLPEYQIAKYPVTEGEYELFIRANGNYRCPDHWRHNRPPEGKTNHPVTNVSWEDANQYCKWLTVMAHNERFIPLEKVVRLPTEAEWEKAMRWDEQESASRLYPWGNQWVGNLCNSIETGLGSTSSVGIFEEGNSPYDLCDGVGNVFEWCNSLEKEYPYKIDDGREMQTVSGFRVVRGGSWNTTELFANCIKRGWLPQTSKTSNFGFRVVVADKIG